jgi:hypothetical protein
LINDVQREVAVKPPEAKKGVRLPADADAIGLTFLGQNLLKVKEKTLNSTSNHI